MLLPEGGAIHSVLLAIPTSAAKARCSAGRRKTHTKLLHSEELPCSTALRARCVTLPLCTACGVACPCSPLPPATQMPRPCPAGSCALCC